MPQIRPSLSFSSAFARLTPQNTIGLFESGSETLAYNVNWPRLGAGRASELAANLLASGRYFAVISYERKERQLCATNKSYLEEAAS